MIIEINILIMILCIFCIIFQGSVIIYLFLLVRKWINSCNYVLKRLIDTENELSKFKLIEFTGLYELNEINKIF